MEAEARVLLTASFLTETDELDFVRCVSVLSTSLDFAGFALFGLKTCFKEGRVCFFCFSCELGGLLELELDFVLRLSEGVWYLVLSLAPPIAELKTAYNWCSVPKVDSTKCFPALNSAIAFGYYFSFS